MLVLTDFSVIALAILPQIGLLILGLLVLGVDLLLPEEKRRSLGWLTAGGLAVLVALTGFLSAPGKPALIWGGMLRHDWLSFIFTLIVMSGASLTALFAMDSETVNRRGEFYMLLLASTLGMTLMAASADLVMLFLAIETTSIPLYAMAGFLIHDNKSTESGFKYLLFGATTSAVMLYGFSLLYGFSGTTQIYQIAEKVQTGGVPLITMLVVLLLVMVGFSFKVSAVPFQFWAPDVYEGSPTPVAGFLSTASKAAGFAVLIRFLLAVFPNTTLFPGLENWWIALLAAVATATMLVGNLLALAQKNIKRLLAYSSIAHAGYILVGVAAASAMGVSGSVYYLIAYLLTNLAAFGVVTVVSRAVGSDDVAAYAGLSRRAPGLAFIFLVALLSLGGIPPFGGFFAKVLVFTSAIQSNLVWLAVIGVLNSVIGLYYYLNILKVTYLYRSEQEGRALSLTRPWGLALLVCTVGIVVLGTLFGPWYQWSLNAAGGLF